MAIEVRMPQLSDTMDTGKILTWLKKEGEVVSRGDALAEVATDKADLEIECFHDGTLLQIQAPEGTTVEVGSVIAIIGEAGESVEAVATQSQETPAPTPAPEPTPNPAPVSPAPEQETRQKISPLARNLAKAHGIDYSSVQGTGEGGRIVKRDIEALVEQGGQSTSPAPTQSAPPAPTASPPPRPAQASTPTKVRANASTSPLSNMRQTIANRMVESVTTIPHFYVTSKIQVDNLIEFRSTLKPLPAYEGITYSHLIIKAAGMALKAVPRINASYVDGQLVQPQDANVGVVTAIPDGLLIPVVKNADALPLNELSQQARGLVQRARSGRPKQDDLIGGTFTISNMGMFDVENFTAIINPGQGAILAVSSFSEEAIAIEGHIDVATVMRINLSVDHRIIDGVMAGESF